MTTNSKKTPLEKLKAKIIKGSFPKSSPHFGGANLIITDDPTYLGHPQDIRILTENANELSWFVFELKEIYEDQIDSLNKYKFYPSIGIAIKEAIEQKKGIIDAMLFVIDKIEKEWK
jgi:hypothetical protein